MGNNQPKPDAFEFAKRLHMALDRIHGCPPKGPRTGRGAWLVSQFKVSEVTASGWLNGRYVPGPTRAQKIADKAGVPFEWLYFGAGEMAGSGSSLPVNAGSDVGQASPGVRPDTLMVAIQESALALKGKHPTPEQHARLITLLYELIEDGMPLAQVKQVARRAAPVSIATGGSNAADRDGTADSSATG